MQVSPGLKVAERPFDLKLEQLIVFTGNLDEVDIHLGFEAPNPIAQ